MESLLWTRRCDGRCADASYHTHHLTFYGHWRLRLIRDVYGA